MYNHPSMNVSTLNAKFFLRNLSKENKAVILTVFNVNLKELFHNNYASQITLPARITDRLATIIYNIFVNTQIHKQTSGNQNYFNI